MPCVAVIPAHRAERTIGATLEALRLGNASAVQRVLVVTSAGDPTAAVVRRWQRSDPAVELLVSKERRTAGAARNAGRAGLRCSAGGAAASRASAKDPAPVPARPDHLLFIDADCRLEAGGAARLEAELTRSGRAALGARVLGGGSVVARVRHMLEFKEAASRRPPPPAWLVPSTVLLCREEAFDLVGGFPDLWPGEDLVFSQSLRDAGLAVGRSDEVTGFHDHPAGIATMLRHQLRLGFTAAVARRSRPMPGTAFTSSPWLAALLLPARSLRLVAWQAGEGAAALAWTLLLSPLLAAGLVAWTAGFVTGTRRGDGAGTRRGDGAGTRRGDGAAVDQAPADSLPGAAAA